MASKAIRRQPPASGAVGGTAGKEEEEGSCRSKPSLCKHRKPSSGQWMKAEVLAKEKEPAAEAEALRASHALEQAKMESCMFERQL